MVGSFVISEGSGFMDNARAQELILDACRKAENIFTRMGICEPLRRMHSDTSIFNRTFKDMLKAGIIVELVGKRYRLSDEMIKARDMAIKAANEPIKEYDFDKYFKGK